MKKYNTPSLKAEVLSITDVIAVSGQPQFVKESTAATNGGTAAQEKNVTWNTAWNID